MADENFISFYCEGCHTEIQASLDMIGQSAECPACGAALVIPDNRNDGVSRHAADEIDKVANDAMKSRTIRIELVDDL